MRREFSAGGVVFKKVKKGRKVKILWLIAKSRPDKNYPKNVWRLPKGWLDDEENGKKPGPYARGEKKADEDLIQKTALREVKEETVVKAKIIKKVGTERFFYKDREELVLKLVSFYLMEYEKDFPEGFDFETSEISWLSFEDAREKLTYSGEKKILEKAKEILESSLEQTG